MADPRDEQSREERLEIARRYRERRGRELRALATSATGGEVEAAGEFSSIPTESLAAIPLFGMLFIPWARWRSRKRGLPPKLLVAIDSENVHALGLEPADMRRDENAVSEVERWPRAGVRVESVRRAFMREVVTLAVSGREEPLVLYAPSLRTNPWSAEVVRLLGGDAPEPLDLGAQPE